MATPPDPEPMADGALIVVYMDYSQQVFPFNEMGKRGWSSQIVPGWIVISQRSGDMRYEIPAVSVRRLEVMTNTEEFVKNIRAWRERNEQ